MDGNDDIKAKNFYASTAYGCEFKASPCLSCHVIYQVCPKQSEVAVEQKNKHLNQHCSFHSIQYKIIVHRIKSGQCDLLG